MGEVNVQVAVRVRPMLPKELLWSHQGCVTVIPGSTQVMVSPGRVFTFDYAFGPSASQDEVYRSCVRPLVLSVLDGYNATMFCYGETGSGKTYTISGGGQDDQAGIIEHVAKELFGCLEEKIRNDEAKVTLTYLELYMEEVRDLLILPTHQKCLAVRDDADGNTVVVGAKECLVRSTEELLSHVETSFATRQTCTTEMNDKSSRSHTVLTIQVNQHCTNKIYTARTSKFCLVDLAGSERVKKTGNCGKHFKEAVHINTDLLTVGNVIRALSVAVPKNCGKKRKGAFIPFRDAKITRLLRDSLGGTSHTLMMTCLNPTSYSLAENLNALIFASKARQIYNCPLKQPACAGQMYTPQLAMVKIIELENEVKVLKEVVEEKEKMIKEVALKNLSPEDQRTNVTLRQEQEPSQNCVLAQEAAGHLAKVCSPGSSFTEQLEWQERLTDVSQQHGEDRMDISISTILNLKEDLEKCTEGLGVKKQPQSVEQHQLQRQEQTPLQENKTSHQGLEEERRHSPEPEPCLEQQKLIGHFHNNLQAAQASLLEAEAFVTTADNTSQSVCLMRHGCKYRETTGRVHSSPPAYSLERVMADFKMRGHILLAENDERDNKKSLLIKRQALNRAMVDVDEDTVVGKGRLRNDQNRTWTRGEKNSASNDRTVETSDSVKNKQSNEHIHAKQLIDKEKIKANETKKRLRDLSVIMGIKKDLLKELVKTEKDLKALLEHSMYTSDGTDDVLQTLSTQSQQTQAQVCSSLQHMKKQRGELQVQLKHIQETSSDSPTTNLSEGLGDALVNKSSHQKTPVEKLPVSCWLEQEEELELERRAELQQLEDEQKRRDEVLKHRDDCAQRINKLESKMLLSRQICQNVGEDLLRVSMSLDSLEISSSELQNGDSSTERQEEERQSLKEKKDTLETQLQDGRVLIVEEEESLAVLEEDREALDAALEFENSCIQERQKRLNSKRSSNKPPNGEPDPLTAVLEKIRTLSAREASELLIKYFDKVVSLRKTMQDLQLRCEELELVVREKEMMINKMDSDRQRLTLDADRWLTQMQHEHQISIQQLLQKLQVSISGEMKQEGEAKIRYLERELLFYKSSARVLRKKLKETSSDVSNHSGDQDKTQNTQPSKSEQDALVETKTKKQTPLRKAAEGERLISKK